MSKPTLKHWFSACFLAFLVGSLSALWAAPVPDKAAVDRTMNEIDTVHAQLKAFNSRPDDQQTY